MGHISRNRPRTHAGRGPRRGRPATATLVPCSTTGKLRVRDGSYLPTRLPAASMYGQGDVAKWSKAEVCKTSIRRFESARRLHTLSPLGAGPVFRRGAHETSLVARAEGMARQLGAGRSRVRDPACAAAARVTGRGVADEPGCLSQPDDGRRCLPSLRYRLTHRACTRCPASRGGPVPGDTAMTADETGRTNEWARGPDLPAGVGYRLPLAVEMACGRSRYAVSRWPIEAVHG